MKFRDYKIFKPNNYYHIFNRGNQKQQIFYDDSDYINFIKRIKIVIGQVSSHTLRIKALPLNSFSFLAYCLMPNHYHFLIRQNSDVGIDRLIAKICTSYAMYFNRKYQKVGNLFQDAFKAKLIEDDNYLKHLSAYIHKNPQDLNTYPYSSYFDYCKYRKGTLCDKSLILSMFNNSASAYNNFVSGFDTNHSKIISHIVFED